MLRVDLFFWDLVILTSFAEHGEARWCSGLASVFSQDADSFGRAVRSASLGASLWRRWSRAERPQLGSSEFMAKSWSEGIGLQECFGHVVGEESGFRCRILGELPRAIDCLRWGVRCSYPVNVDKCVTGRAFQCPTECFVCCLRSWNAGAERIDHALRERLTLGTAFVPLCENHALTDATRGPLNFNICISGEQVLEAILLFPRQYVSASVQCFPCALYSGSLTRPGCPRVSG